MAQLAQGLGLDLADALAGDVELLADLFQRVVGVHVDAEAHAQDLGFAGGEPGKHVLGGLFQAFPGGGLHRGEYPGVFDEIAQLTGIITATNRAFQRDRLFSRTQHTVHFLGGVFQASV